MPNDLDFDDLLPLLPRAVRWAQRQEMVILRNGTPLTPAQVADALCIGVQHPHRVRILHVNAMPVPETPQLNQIARMTSLLTPNTLGLCLRYGIYLHKHADNNPRIIRHELAHTAQYERLGGFMPFLRQYLQECLTIGYPHGPLETEARNAESWFSK